MRGVVHAVTRGYNGTVLVFGQTGSGKTHTVRGSSGGEEGLLPLALRELFALLGRAPGATVAVSYVELYNEVLQDLLADKRKVRWCDGVRLSLWLCVALRLLSVARFGSHRTHRLGSVRRTASSRATGTSCT